MSGKDLAAEGWSQLGEALEQMHRLVAAVSTAVAPLYASTTPLCLLSRDLLHRFIPGFIKRLGITEEGHQLSRNRLTIRNMMRSYLK